MSATVTATAGNKSWFSWLSGMSFAELLLVGFLVLFGPLILYIAYAADVSEEKHQALREQYLEQRECVVVDMTQGFATKYRCNKPYAGQYVSAERVNSTIAAKCEYLQDNNCSRAASEARLVTSYRCETSEHSATYVSDAEVTAQAEKRYLTAN